MKTLLQIINKEKKIRKEKGEFGINACKESILSSIRTNKMLNEKYGRNDYNTSLYVLLEKYVERANKDVFFNDTMVLACWELINNK